MKRTHIETVESKQTVVDGFDCDRCGAVIEQAICGSPLDGMQIILDGGYDAYLDGNITGDLCRVCVESLGAWLGRGRLRASFFGFPDIENWPPEQNESNGNSATTASEDIMSGWMQPDEPTATTEPEELCVTCGGRGRVCDGGWHLRKGDVVQVKTCDGSEHTHPPCPTCSHLRRKETT